MTKTFQTLAMCFGLFMAVSAAVAQTAPAAAGDAAVPTDLSMGAEQKPGLPSEADAKVGDTYQSATFDKWQQRCSKTADGSDPCQLYQLLFDKDGNSVAEISLFGLPDGGQAAAGATFMAPLETLLTANLKIAIDGAKAKIYPFAYCTKNGCVARLGFTADEVAALKKGVKAMLTIVPAAAPDAPVDLEMTLKGFTAGLQAVTDAKKP